MKKITLVLSLILLGAAFWFFFIKKYDYQFESIGKYGPGAVYYELSGWERFGNSERSTPVTIIHKDPFKSITQRIEIDNKTFVEFNWDLEKRNDSVTDLTLNVLSNKNHLKNRWDIINPFSTSPYIDSIKNNLLDFKKELNANQDLYRIKAETEITESPAFDCVCYSSSNIPIVQKAGEMMATISFLENYLIKNDLKLNGYPFLNVTAFNRIEQIIDFDFCFPLESIEGLEETINLKLKTFPSRPAYKAIFNGNYKLSHIAWFDLLYLAEEKGVTTSGLPLEVFFDNPKFDSDELNWKAEIYLPVAE